MENGTLGPKNKHSSQMFLLLLFTTKADKQSEQKCESDIDNNDNNDNDDNDAACGPNDPSAAALENRVISNSHGGIHLYYTSHQIIKM